MRAIITSDVHLGSRHLDCRRFCRFLDEFPKDTSLILNGDTVGRNVKKLQGPHEEALEKIKELSRTAQVIWIRGNHDEDYKIEDGTQIDFRESYILDKKVVISHGHDFHNERPVNLPMTLGLRIMKHLRKLYTSEPLSMNKVLRKFSFLYTIICRHVKANAVQMAREKNCIATVCGHVHFHEEDMVNGIRYINTGTWLTDQALLVMYDNEKIDTKIIDTRK